MNLKKGNSLLREYGIKEDWRYPICLREAVICLSLYVLTAAVSIFLMYFTTPRPPEEYTLTWGLPTFIFWGILVTQAASLVAIIILLRYVFQDIPLDDLESSDS